MPRPSNAGSALLTALFIMTLVAIAATAMSTRLQLDIYRTDLTIRSDKLYLAAQAVPFWAMDQLRIKQKRFNSIDAFGQVLPFPGSLQHLYPGIKITGTLYDLQARINLNNLRDAKFRGRFLRFLEKHLPNKQPQERRAIVEAIAFWVNNYKPGQGVDKLTEFYLKLTPPSVPSHQLMESISELRMVQGIDSKIYNTLAPYLTALPKDKTPVNINTASEAVLMTLGNGLNESQVHEILQLRAGDGFKNDGDLNILLGKLDIPIEQITLESNYFLSETQASNAEGNSLHVYTIIERIVDEETKQIKVRMVSETLNTL